MRFPKGRLLGRGRHLTVAGGRMRRFDLIGFHRYLDGERQKRKLSWAQLAEEVNRPFTNTPSIPIHPATLRDMPKKQSVTSAVVLQVLRWLGRSPEAFLVPPDEKPEEEAA